jgi:hypothetical protein
MQSYDKGNNSKIKKSEVSVAKNYLKEDEIKLLGLIVEQYLAFAETMALEKTPMYMKDWVSRLDVIVQLNGKELLTHAGKISHQMALEKSSKEFEKHTETQKQIDKENSIKELEEDLSKLTKKIKGKRK